METGKWMKETTNEDRGGRIGQGRADGKSKRGFDLPNYVFYLPSRTSSVQKSISALMDIEELRARAMASMPNKKRKRKKLSLHPL